MAYTAVIVEPRSHRALELVLLNFNRNLDDNWSFLIYHGNNNEQFIKDIIRNNDTFTTRTIQLVSLNVDNLSISDYNKLFFTDFFYENIHTEMFLIFQTDTLISDVYNKNIYDFMEYDYVGAPWKSGFVGNGGFSLRRKSKMIEMKNIGKFDFDNGNGEDLFFSNSFEDTKLLLDVELNKPSFDKAQQFSVETVFFDKSIGLHKPWSYLSESEIEILKTHFFNLEKLIHIHRN
jgi:hypothetical protein